MAPAVAQGIGLCVLLVGGAFGAVYAGEILGWALGCWLDWRASR